MRDFLIPTFWRYLLKEYFRVFSLSVACFISVLLVTRIKEIAEFTSIASEVKNVVLFIMYQIPYILPIAVPISCLIASILLMQKLSHSNELTALRANGLSLSQIATPILYSGVILFFINFLIVSEISPRSRIQSKNIIFEESSVNPILLLQRQQLLQLKETWIDFKPTSSPYFSNDLIFFNCNKKSGTLNLLLAKELELKNDEVIAKKASMLSYLPSDDSSFFDTLILENQRLIKTKAHSLSQIMKNGHYNLTSNYLPFRLLLVKNKYERKKNKFHQSIFVEITRRFALGFSAFSLTFIGIAFGIDIGRMHSKRKILIATLLTLLVLISFTIKVKSFKYHPILACSIYLLPQLFFILLAKRSLNRSTQGIE
jgi:lipopolysaccharide export system permease protein